MTPPRDIFEIEKVERWKPYQFHLDKTSAITDYSPDSTIAETLDVQLTSDCIGMSIETYLSKWPLKEDDQKVLQAQCKKIVKGELTTFEIHVDVQVDDETVHLHIAGQRLASGNACIGVRDESDLTKMKREMQEAVNLYTQSIGMVAHEFRSPLITIGGFARILLKRAEDEKIKEMLRPIVTGASNLEAIVTQFLDSYRIENQEFVTERRDVDVYGDAIGPALEELTHAALENQVVIDHNASLRRGEIVAPTDATCLKIVYRNLFSNAIKYGGVGARIAYGVEDCDDHYRFNVWNNNSGIKEEDIKLLFKRFGKIRSEATGKVTGTGLGLYNTKAIVEKLGGKIWVESDGRSYTNFVFTLLKG